MIFIRMGHLMLFIYSEAQPCQFQVKDDVSSGNYGSLLENHNSHNRQNCKIVAKKF